MKKGKRQTPRDGMKYGLYSSELICGAAMEGCRVSSVDNILMVGNNVDI